MSLPPVTVQVTQAYHMFPPASTKTAGSSVIGVACGVCHCGPQFCQLVYCHSQTLTVLDTCAMHARTWMSPHCTLMLYSGAHNHWSTLCHNHYVAAMQCWRPCLPFWFGMIRDAGLTKPCLAEGTGLVGIRCPDVTRLVDMPQPSCYYGGKYDKGRCERHDCPRVSLGHGAWHVAFPELIKAKKQGKLADRCSSWTSPFCIAALRRRAVVRLSSAPRKKEINPARKALLLAGAGTIKR